MMRTRTRRSGGPLEEALTYINVKDKEASFCVLQIAQKGTKHPLVSDESLTIRKKFKESPLSKTANKFKTAVPSRPKKVPWSEEEQAAVKRHLG